jgi:histidinol-phosphate aminotransferase
LTQLVAEQVLGQQALLAQQAAAIKSERARLFTKLEPMPGVQAFPSDANFILFRTGAAEQVFNDLRRQGVLIKNLHGSHPALADCLRVTVGTPAENDKFQRALSKAVNT